jgi:uncharacterized membrane protein
MKAKHAVFLIVLGFCLGFIGALFQIMHRSEAQSLLIIATVLKVAGVLLLGYKVVKYESFRKFMER